jgi:hypothetical protein
MDFRRHPDLRILRLDALAKRMEARWRVLMERRSPHALCMANRYSRFELAGDALAMAKVSRFRDAA